jgi:hypothetical protein
MAINRIKSSYLTLSAIIGLVIYCALTYLAASHYPYAFGPLESYLSVLGNSGLNPEGAVYYNTGVILAGLSVLPFYLGVYLSWHTKFAQTPLSVATLMGMVNCAAIVMSAVFSEDVYDLHFFWSFMIFLSWIPVLLITNWLFIRAQGWIRVAGMFGLGLGLFDTGFVLYVLAFGSSAGSILEWVTIFAFFGWAVLVALLSVKSSR